ncbi:right-handed parallel beta-helix repeat-containing protein [Paraglaciecola aquimarina]|uniref:Right-handed parallel beta-helix repeat-containing protein n=1 Tax=Paraglaciecola aquimarina TaxID=1235557 RepID=A0ABU3SU73_9ALTE|nr:right-handed parallel beta-helix repeat-containing protein [Paraglaciecola aquimarina]MDU0353559.1 right-handed parallel beta-helix repeat-containing protein [Paraglaciecola aquimarina]
MKLNTSKKFTLSVLALVCSLGASAKTIYVDTSGDDANNDGSEIAPYATFQKANANLVAGDTLIVGGGVYRQTMKITASGTAEAPILVRAKTGENVVIKATEEISGWTHYTGDIYSANVNMDITEWSRNIYQNGELMQIARWPNDVDNDAYTIDTHVINELSTASSIKVSGVPDVDLTGGYMWYLGQHSGTSWTKQITSNTASEIVFPEINVARWPYSNHNPAEFFEGGYGRFYVYGKLALLDHPREWHYDANTQTLYFQSVDGSMPSDSSVEYTARERAIEINGSHVDVEGISAWGGNVKLNGRYIRYANSNVTYGSQRRNNYAPDSGASITDGSINVIGMHNLVENNVVHHGSNNGIHVAGWANAGDFAVIQNNEIRYFDTLGIHASLIRSNGDNVKILKNTVSHVGRDAIYVSGFNNEFAYNDVSYAGMINNDGGLFYTVGNTENRNIEVHHNWFHDAMRRDYHDQKMAGIYLDNDSKGFLVHHNVVWNVPWTGLQLNWDNWDNHMYHNTFIDVGGAMGEWINGRNPRDNRVWNNFSTDADWIRSDAYDLDSNIISALSQFVNADGHDFMPHATSLLLDAGRVIDDVEGFNKAFAGTAPDVGAYEAGGTLWTAGINAIEDTCNTCLSDPNSAPVHPPVAASIMFDNRGEYLSTDYDAGSSMQVSVNYDAGTGHKVTDVLGGVRFYLRTIDTTTGDWITVSEVSAEDATAIGQRAGSATATLSLAGLVPSQDLPDNQFYYLFVIFEASDGTRKTASASPIKILPDSRVAPSFGLDDANKYRTTDYFVGGTMDVTVNYEVGTGNTVVGNIGGIRYFLRHMNSNWKVIEDIRVNDGSVIGTQSGISQVAIPLAGVVPTADLPEGDFYFLFVSIASSDGTTTNTQVRGINILSAPASVQGDWDEDGDVDSMDVRGLMGAVLSRQAVDLAFDFNGDEVVNMLDVRALAPMCTRARCATN